MYDAFIFDMDGTLVDTVSKIKESWNITFKNNNANKVLTDDDIKGIMGLAPVGMAKKLLPDMDLEKAVNLITTSTYEEIPYLKKHYGTTYIKDVSFLEKLSKNHKLFIVSNCLEGYIETFLDHFNYNKYFIETVNAGNKKTKAENIAYLVKKYNLVNPCYVGDTILDYQSSNEAKVNFIHASYGFGIVDCPNKISNLEELLTK